MNNKRKRKLKRKMKIPQSHACQVHFFPFRNKVAFTRNHNSAGIIKVLKRKENNGKCREKKKLQQFMIGLLNYANLRSLA